MQTDLKNKRKVAGFIRTNSFKALPTFKNTAKNQSSEDFSSFQNDNSRSDEEFSPYKDDPVNVPKRPPLPQKAQQKTNSNNQIGIKPQKNLKIDYEQDPIQIFSNQKLKRNYEPDIYQIKNSQPSSNYNSNSPNCGKIVNKNKSKSTHLNINSENAYMSNLDNMNRREQQIRQALRKRAEVQNQLAQIDKICGEIDQFKKPSQFQQRYQKMTSNYTPKSLQKQENLHKREYHKEAEQERKKSALSYEKYKYLQKQKQKNYHLQQITFQPHKNNSKKLVSQTPKVTFAGVVQNNPQGRKSFPNVTSNSNLNYRSPSNNYPKEAPKININEQIQSYASQQPQRTISKLVEKSRERNRKNYQFEQSQIQEKSSSGNSSFQQNSGQKINEEEQFSTFKCEQTFKPNANQQILTSLQQYKKQHPQQYQNLPRNQSKNIQNQNPNIHIYTNAKKQASTSKMQSSYRPDLECKDKIKNQHERARKKFFSTKEPDLENQNEDNNQEENDQFQHQDKFEDENQDESSGEVQSEDFSEIEGNKFRDAKKIYQQEDLVQQDDEDQQQLITQYPTGQFKKSTIKQCIELRNSNQNNYSSINNKNQNYYLPTKKTPQQLQNNSGIHKSKGGICFDLDINQFTQHETKAVSKQQAVQIVRKNKKANTKEEILKRRQMAKNYDKQARARVFGGY